MDRAHQELDKAICVIKFIRRQRFMKLVLEYLLDPSVHKELKERCRFEEVQITDPPQDDDQVIEVKQF